MRKLSHRSRPTGNAAAAAARFRRLALSLLRGALGALEFAALAEELDLGLFLTPIGRAATLRIGSRRARPPWHVSPRLARDRLRARPARSRPRCGARDRTSWGCTGEGRTRSLVSDLSRADLFASVALFEVFELSVGLHSALTRSAEGASKQLEVQFGLADVRAGIGVALASEGSTYVAARADLTFPTASDHTWSGAR